MKLPEKYPVIQDISRSTDTPYSVMDYCKSLGRGGQGVLAPPPQKKVCLPPK